MKKRLLLLIAVIASMAMFASGCGSDTVTDLVSDAADTAGDAAGDVADAAEDVVDDAADAVTGDDDAMEEDAMEEEEAMEEEAMEEEPAAEEEEAAVDLTQSGDLTFHMITHSDDGPFWSVVKRGMDAAAEDLGVTAVWLGSNNDPGVQVQLIEQAISEGSNGIAASLPSPDQLIPPLQDAVANGIPVYTLNSGVNQYGEIGATTHVGQTEFIAGQGAGRRFNDLGATKILCGRQEESNVALEERCDGLEDTFEGEVVSQFIGLDADQTTQQANINAALSADGDIDGFMGVGPVIAVSGLRAGQDLGKDLHIGGFDITPEIIDEIEAGNIAFTVDQQQYLQGYMPILLMFLEVTNKNTLGGGLPILTGPGFVTQENAADVKALVAQGTR